MSTTHHGTINTLPLSFGPPGRGSPPPSSTFGLAGVALAPLWDALTFSTTSNPPLFGPAVKISASVSCNTKQLLGRMDSPRRATTVDSPPPVSNTSTVTGESLGSPVSAHRAATATLFCVAMLSRLLLLSALTAFPTAIGGIAEPLLLLLHSPNFEVVYEEGTAGELVCKAG